MRWYRILNIFSHWDHGKTEINNGPKTHSYTGLMKHTLSKLYPSIIFYWVITYINTGSWTFHQGFFFNRKTIFPSKEISIIKIRHFHINGLTMGRLILRRHRLYIEMTPIIWSFSLFLTCNQHTILIDYCRVSHSIHSSCTSIMSSMHGLVRSLAYVSPHPRKFYSYQDQTNGFS